MKGPLQKIEVESALEFADKVSPSEFIHDTHRIDFQVSPYFSSKTRVCVRDVTLRN